MTRCGEVQVLSVEDESKDEKTKDIKELITEGEIIINSGGVYLLYKDGKIRFYSDRKKTQKIGEIDLTGFDDNAQKLVYNELKEHATTVREKVRKEKKKQAKAGTKTTGGSNAEQGEDKLPSGSTYSLRTTTFREVDKAIAEALGVQFKKSAQLQDVLKRLGQLVIYSLLQLGIVKRDEIVTYAEKVTEDPNLLYLYVKQQLDALLRITDEKGLKKVLERYDATMRENEELKGYLQVMAEKLEEYKSTLDQYNMFMVMMALPPSARKNVLNNMLMFMLAQQAGFGGGEEE